MQDELADALGVDADGLRAEFHNVEHHQAHVASAFFVSPFDEAAVLTDRRLRRLRVGDVASAAATGSRSSTACSFPHSLGIFYTAVTQCLGFPKYGDECKVMGLAPYGEPARILRADARARAARTATLRARTSTTSCTTTEGVDMTWDERTPTIGRVFSAAARGGRSGRRASRAAS